MTPFPLLRHQLPVRSPLPLPALRSGLRSLLRRSEDPRPALLARLRDRLEARDGILTDTGTSALRLALEMTAEGGRAPVALPSYSCYDVATAAVGARVPVLLYDLDPRTLSPDLASLERALDSGAGSVVVAPLHGFPVAWGAITDLAARRGAVVVEDAAQAHGSGWGARPAGRFGDLVVLSFGRGKGWTGSGGGALVVRDPAWTDRLAALRPRLRPEGSTMWTEALHLARAGAQWGFGRPGVYGLPRRVPALGLGETRYREPAPPGSMPRTAAAVTLATEEVARAEVPVRRSRAARYRDLLEEEAPDVRPVDPVPEGWSGYLRFPVLLAEGPELPDEAIPFGLERSYPLALVDLPPLHPLLTREVDPFPEARGGRVLARRLVTFPTHRAVGPAEQRRLVAAVGTRSRRREAGAPGAA